MFEGNSFTTPYGSSLKAYKSPSYGDLYDNAYEETPMPLHSIIDFNTTPVRCCPSTVLHNYISSHLGYEDSKNREDLIKNETKTCKLNKCALEQEKIPMQMHAWSSQGVFLPAEGGML